MRDDLALLLMWPRSPGPGRRLLGRHGALARRRRAGMALGPEGRLLPPS